MTVTCKVRPGRASPPCVVQSGVLHDPNAGTTVNFVREETTLPLVPIEHVIALGDSWQKGGQQLSSAERIDLANDPLNLIAAMKAPNSVKSDSDAASWLPPSFSAPVNLNTVASYPPESLACGKTLDATPRPLCSPQALTERIRHDRSRSRSDCTFGSSPVRVPMFQLLEVSERMKNMRLAGRSARRRMK